MSIDRDSENYWESVVQSPIWRTIPAVRHNHAVRVDRSVWFGQGVLACGAIIDDVLAAAKQ
jgi:ABC-type Fe3+-citrate transport system substrate-binding protein